MIRIEGGKKKASCKWYQYEAQRLADYFDETNAFDGKNHISAEDVIENIVYGTYGCFDLLDSLKLMKTRMKIIEDQITNGKWLTTHSASLPSFLSNKMDMFISNITNTKKLEQLGTLIQEDLYSSYFVHVVPNIVLSEPILPKFPKLPVQTYPNKKDNYKKIKKLIEDTIPYLEVLEKYHHKFFDLISETNAGLEAIISR